MEVHMGANLTRINANIPAMQSMNVLNQINNKIADHQLRLATGKRINSPGDDPAGYQLAQGLTSRRNGLEVALDNVSNAQSILNVAEGGYQNIMDIVQTLKQKATQAADGSLSVSQRSAINDQVSALLSEVDEIVSQTTFNDQGLIDGNFSATSFQTGEQANETLAVSLQGADSAALSINNVDVSSQASASTAMTSLDAAIDNLASRIQDVGEYKSRLQTKEATLTVAITNTENVRSNIEDADFAKEQMEIMKMQILQQTAMTSLSQANTGPQIVLSLFR
jgi:flagellin